MQKGSALPSRPPFLCAPGRAHYVLSYSCSPSKSLPADTGQLHSFGNRPGPGTIMGDHATCHPQGLGSACQGELVSLHPTIKVGRGKQAGLFATELIQPAGSQVQAARPIEAMSPFFDRNLGEKSWIGKRGKSGVTADRGGKVTGQGFTRAPGDSQMKCVGDLRCSNQGGFAHRFNLRYSATNSLRCANIHATAGAIRLIGRAEPARISMESRAIETREPSRKSMCACGTGCSSPPLMRIFQSPSPCTVVMKEMIVYWLHYVNAESTRAEPVEATKSGVRDDAK